MARCTFWLFVSLTLFYALTTSGRLHTVDEYEAFYMTESLAERGEVSLPKNKWFFGKEGLDGKYYAPYGPLPPLVAVPGYWVGKAAVLAGGSSSLRESMVWLATTAVNAVACAAAAALFFLLAWRLGARPRPALAAAAILALATPHWHYATTFFSEPISSLLLIAAAYALTRHFQEREGERELGALFLAGLPLAFLAATRLTTAIFFPFFGVAVLILVRGGVGRKLAAAASFCALPALAIGLYLLWNYHRFGNAFDLGYPEAMEGNRSPSNMDGDLLRGLYGLTFSPGKGLFVFALPTLVGLVGCRGFLRQTKTLGWCFLALPCAALLFYSKYSQWEGGYCWGPRYLVPAIGFWILPLAFFRFPTWSKVATASATAASALLGFLGITVSFLECQVNRGYYTRSFQYDLDYDAFSATTSVVVHYLDESMAGRFLAEAEGLGFDRWFLFLYKNGASGLTLALVVVVLTALLVTSVVFLGKSALAAESRQGSDELPRETETPIPVRTAESVLTDH